MQYYTNTYYISHRDKNGNVLHIGELVNALTDGKQFATRVPIVGFLMSILSSVIKAGISRNLDITC